MSWKASLLLLLLLVYAAGKAAHFSEQQLMDCSWDYEGNSACDGGNYDGALDYLIDAGGAVLDSDYEYLGQDGWCLDRNHSDTHTTNLTKFKVRLLCYWLDLLCVIACGDDHMSS